MSLFFLTLHGMLPLFIDCDVPLLFYTAALFLFMLLSSVSVACCVISYVLLGCKGIVLIRCTGPRWRLLQTLITEVEVTVAAQHHLLLYVYPDVASPASLHRMLHFTLHRVSLATLTREM